MEQVPLIASAFDPSGLLYATAIPVLDLHKVQIYQVSADASHTLQSDFTLEKGHTVQTIAWTTCSSSKASKQQRKKRKRSLNESTASQLDEDLVVAIGTNKGSVILFSPFQSVIVSSLSGGHSVPVTSLASVQDSTNLWSCDRSGVIARWNLSNRQSKPYTTSTISSDVRTVHPITAPNRSNQLLIASSSVFVVDLSRPTETVISYPGFAHPVSSIQLASSNDDIFFASSKSERNINVQSFSEGKTIAVLTAQSDVQSAALNLDDSALAAVTDDGFVEIFTNPLKPVSIAGSRRKSASLAAKPVATLKVVRPNKAIVKIQSVFFKDDELILSWLENASIPVFESIKWKPLTGDVEIVRTRKVVVATTRSAQGIDPSAAIAYNEGQAVVTSGKDLANLDSDNEDEEEGGTLAERLEALEVDRSTNGSILKESRLDLSTPGTFTTILSQALKSNDHSLLETCLSNREENIIKLSVQKLDSQLAVKLIERIAEKIARNPTLAGNLNVWIKWVMIAHGGYLVTLPNLLKTLSSLHSTLSESVNALPRLLALQGRLEMLSSQMELRRDLARKNDNEEGLEDEDETEVTYVEDGAYIANGEDDSEDESAEEEEEESDESDSADIGQFIDNEAEDDFQGSDMEVDGDEDDAESESEAEFRSKNGSSKGRQ